ncbi:MAG: 30S ribosomal protein S8 [Nitrosarchaeum sp.]|nr:30S ribosomal protein S8 [Nitrosarchaeum sp.]
MSMNDPLANVLSHVKNYEHLRKESVLTKSSSKVIRKVLEILQEEGYLGGFTEHKDAKGNLLAINLMGKINDVGVVKPRFQIGVLDFEKFEKRYLPAKGFGVLVISTDQGIMTHAEAKERGIGGRLLAYCY